MSGLSPTERYYPSLMDGDTDETHALFGGVGDVHDPWGNVGEPEFYMWAGARHIWLYLNKGKLETGRTTRSGSRVCVEYMLHVVTTPPKVKKISLPLAVVGEEEGDRLVRVRVYHTMKPMFGVHDNRWPILQADPEIALPDPVLPYQRAMAAGDLEAVLATLEPEAVVREPAGAPWVHNNPDRHRKLYKGHLALGGVTLENCNLIDDGEAVALEYNVLKWGKDEVLPPRPGVTVFERSPNGKLQAVRVYEDLDPPE